MNRIEPRLIRVGAVAGRGHLVHRGHVRAGVAVHVQEADPECAAGQFAERGVVAEHGVDALVAPASGPVPATWCATSSARI